MPCFDLQNANGGRRPPYCAFIGCLLSQRADPLEFGRFENRQDTPRQIDQFAFAEGAHHPAHMNRSQPDHLSNMLLAQRKGIALECRAASQESLGEMEKQIGEPLFRCAPADHRYQFVHVITLSNAGLRQCSRNRGIGCDPGFDCCTAEAAYPDFGQCLN